MATWQKEIMKLTTYMCQKAKEKQNISMIKTIHEVRKLIYPKL